MITGAVIGALIWAIYILLAILVANGELKYDKVFILLLIIVTIGGAIGYLWH